MATHKDRVVATIAARRFALYGFSPRSFLIPSTVRVVRIVTKNNPVRNAQFFAVSFQLASGWSVAGDQDPVGQYGTGVYQTANWLSDNGNDVTTVLYTGYRHEIHNYADLKEDVEEGIITFFDSCLMQLS